MNRAGRANAAIAFGPSPAVFASAAICSCSALLGHLHRRTFLGTNVHIILASYHSSSCAGSHRSSLYCRNNVGSCIRCVLRNVGGSELGDGIVCLDNAHNSSATRVTLL